MRARYVSGCGCLYVQARTRCRFVISNLQYEEYVCGLVKAEMDYSVQDGRRKSSISPRILLDSQVSVLRPRPSSRKALERTESTQTIMQTALRSSSSALATR
jgi:hypothetical protein